MFKLLLKVNQKLFIAIPVMLLMGFAGGVLWDPGSLKHAIVPLTFLMVYPMMVTLKVRKVFQRGDGKAQCLAQAINFGVIPFAVLLIGRLFFPNEPYLALGLLLAGLVPTSGMTISWTGFAKGNVEAAVKMTVIGLVLGSLATPVYVKLLMGADIDMDVWLVVRQILLIVFLPMVAGHLTQSLLLRRYGQDAFQKRIAPRFPALSTLGVLGAEGPIRPAIPGDPAGNLCTDLGHLCAEFRPQHLGRETAAAARGCHRSRLRDRHAQPLDRPGARHQCLRPAGRGRGPGGGHVLCGTGTGSGLVCEVHRPDLRFCVAGRRTAVPDRINGPGLCRGPAAAPGLTRRPAPNPNRPQEEP